MIPPSAILASPSRSHRRIPKLQPGDVLTRAEFERRWNAMPALKNAELIEGIVYMPPPISDADHGSPHFRLITILGTYAAQTPGVEGGDNSSLRLDMDNMPQPDAFLRILESQGGQCRIDADGYVEGAPELIAEVAASSASYDLHAKLNVYRRNGVKEYIVWRVLDRAFDYLVLEDTQYVPLNPDRRGCHQSRVFPGLWLDSKSLIGGNMAQALNALRKGLACRAHADFVKSLNQPRRGKT